MPIWLLRLLHWIGLTNLSDEDVGRYARLKRGRSATEYQAFVSMLTRAGIGHGTRTDYDSPGVAVQVEHQDGTVTDWWFDESGLLLDAYVCTDGE